MQGVFDAGGNERRDADVAGPDFRRKLSMDALGAVMPEEGPFSSPWFIPPAPWLEYPRERFHPAPPHVRRKVVRASNAWDRFAVDLRRSQSFYDIGPRDR